jgi:hypothetical protein
VYLDPELELERGIAKNKELNREEWMHYHDERRDPRDASLRLQQFAILNIHQIIGSEVIGTTA